MKFKIIFQSSKFGGSRSSCTSTCLGSSSCHGLFSGNSGGDRANSGALEVLEGLEGQNAQKMPRMITLWSGWLVCLVWLPLFWPGFAVGLCFVCFCLFVCLFVWLVIVAMLYLIALIGWGHKGTFESDEDPGRLGSAGSPMKLIDPSILSELAIDVERVLNRNGK